MAKMTLFFHYVVYLLLRLFCGIINLIPYSMIRLFAKLLGSLFYYIHPPRRKIALENLNHAFGDEYTQNEIKYIARDSFKNLALLAVESIRIPKMLATFSDYVDIKNDQVITEILKSGRGIILLIAHYGNWELMAVKAGLLKYPISAVGRPMKNKFIYRYIKRLRQKTGLKVLNKKGSAKEIIRELKSGRILAILFDQYAGGSALPVKFFGRTAYTTPAVAQLALRTGAIVVPAFDVRNPNGKHTIHVETPLKTINTGNRAEDIKRNTELYNNILEKWIRKNPSQWFWFHKRWKLPRKYS